MNTETKPVATYPGGAVRYSCGIATTPLRSSTGHIAAWVVCWYHPSFGKRVVETFYGADAGRNASAKAAQIAGGIADGTVRQDFHLQGLPAMEAVR